MSVLHVIEKKNHSYIPSKSYLFRHSWANELVPVITSAQSKLAVRLSRHLPHTKNSSNNITAERGDKLHPAAHLDPGPDGYNIYGKTGHSFALTSVPLDTKLSTERLQGQGSNEGERALSRARSMLSRYCAAQMDHKLKNESVAKGEQTWGSKGDDSVKTESLACPTLPLTQASPVVSSYDEAISKLLKSGQKELAAQAMSELGDVMWHGGHSKTAERWWREVLSTVSGIQDPGGWRKMIDSSEGGGGGGGEKGALSQFGVWGCLLAAINASKLARLAL